MYLGGLRDEPKHPPLAFKMQPVKLHVISDCSSHASEAYILASRMVFARIASDPRTSDHFAKITRVAQYSDRGSHFSSYLSIGYAFGEICTFYSRTVSMNFFGEMHGKGDEDSEFQRIDVYKERYLERAEICNGHDFAVGLMSVHDEVNEVRRTKGWKEKIMIVLEYTTEELKSAKMPKEMRVPHLKSTYCLSRQPTLNAPVMNHYFSDAQATGHKAGCAVADKKKSVVTEGYHNSRAVVKSKTNWRHLARQQTRLAAGLARVADGAPPRVAKSAAERKRADQKKTALLPALRKASIKLPAGKKQETARKLACTALQVIAVWDDDLEVWLTSTLLGELTPQEGKELKKDAKRYVMQEIYGTGMVDTDTPAVEWIVAAACKASEDLLFLDSSAGRPIGQGEGERSGVGTVELLELDTDDEAQASDMWATCDRCGAHRIISEAEYDRAFPRGVAFHCVTTERTPPDGHPCETPLSEQEAEHGVDN